MVVAKVKYVERAVAKGRYTYFYYRREGRRLARLPGEPGDPKFLKAWSEANDKYDLLRKAEIRDREPIQAGSFREMAIAYLASPEFLDRKKNTRKNYRLFTGLACDLLGDEDRDEIRMAHILEIRNSFASTPAKANELMKQIRIIYKWGRPRDLLKNTTLNPADFRDTDIKKFKGGEFLPWPEPMIERFLAESEPIVAWVVMVGLYTGQRIGDVLAMSWGDVKDGQISVVQEKTGKRLLIPLHSDLRNLLDAIPKRSTRILTSKSGIPWTYSNWIEVFAPERNRLAPGYHFHGTRKNAVIRLLHAGCTIPQAGSITGQTDETVSYYARQIEQEKLAKVAMEKYEAWSLERG